MCKKLLLARVIVGVLMMITTLLLYYFVRALVTVDASNDLTVYREAARAVIHENNPYLLGRTTHYEGVGDVTWRYLYPPLLAVVLSYFEQLGEWWLVTFWSVLTTLSLVTVGWILSRQLRRPDRLAPIMIVAVTLWPVTLDGIERGQINAWILAILFVWFTAARTGNHSLAGVMVGLGVHLKLTPLLLALPYLSRGTRNFWISLALTVLLLGLGISLCSENLWGFYLKNLLSLGGGSSGWISPENLSLSKVLVGLFPTLQQTGGVFIHYFLLVAISLYLVIKGTSTGNRLTPLYLSRVTLLFIVASPLLWYHHMVWLLLPLSVLLSQGRPFPRQVLLIAFGVIVSSYRIIESFFLPSNGWSQQLILVEPVLWTLFILVLWVMNNGRGRCSYDRPLALPQTDRLD